MNKNKLVIVSLIFVFLCGCAGNFTIQKARQHGARQLTGYQLLKLMPENTMHLVSWNNDMRVDVVCRANGKLIADNNRGEKSDGSWSISQGDKLCLRFKDWSFGDKLCYSVFQQDEKFMAFRSDGGLEYNFVMDRMPDNLNQAVNSGEQDKSSLSPGKEDREKSWWDTLTAKEKPKPVTRKQTEKGSWWKFWGSNDSSGSTVPAAAEEKDDDHWWNILTAKEKKQEVPDYIAPEENDEHWWDVLNFFDNEPGYDVGVAEPQSEIQKQLYKTGNCPQCNLNGLDMHGVNLEEANLAGANLAGANLEHANLAGANLRDADLSGANLAETNLVNSDLSGADLSGANLHWAVLSKANFSGSKLNNSYLVKADCYKADFTRADLTGAILQRANLDQATGLPEDMANGKKSEGQQLTKDK